MISSMTTDVLPFARPILCQRMRSSVVATMPFGEVDSGRGFCREHPAIDQAGTVLCEPTAAADSHGVNAIDAQLQRP